jgi:aryl-alcohol dehydrogenase-like predicted oxidoreductase
MAENMQYNRLGNTDLKLSKLSYGASPLGNVFGNVDESVGIRTVHNALDNGINYIDCSPYYGLGKAETLLGKALKDIDRDRYVLSSKAGRYGAQITDFDMSEKRIRQSLEESLQRLGVEELDIFFLHDIEFVDLNQVLNEALPCLETLKKEGKIRYFGVTGYPLKSLQYIVNHYEIDCLLTYCRYALHDRSLANIIPEITNKGIGLINASPTAMGLLTKRGAPDWHPASQALKECCKKAITLCEKQGVNITELAMQFAVNHPDISSTLVGTANPDNLRLNLQWIENPYNKELAEAVIDIFKDSAESVWASGLIENSDY